MKRRRKEMTEIADVTIRNDIRPGDIGSLIKLHALIYYDEYGYDTEFEAYVAKTFFDFFTGDMSGQRLWIVEQGGEIVGCIGVAKKSDGKAQLRWLLLHPDVRGRGLAKDLIRKALDFAKERGFASIFLLTEDVLTDAAGLYDLFGFKLTEQAEEKLKWGRRMRYQRYEREL
ncbi:MAG: GNAT family N-acetyltransferase [Thermoplasmatota archaeon]